MFAGSPNPTVFLANTVVFTTVQLISNGLDTVKFVSVSCTFFEETKTSPKEVVSTMSVYPNMGIPPSEGGANQ